MEPQLSRLHLFGASREVDAAYDDWGANCGPLAIAAATGRSLADLAHFLAGEREGTAAAVERVCQLAGAVPA